MALSQWLMYCGTIDSTPATHALICIHADAGKNLRACQIMFWSFSVTKAHCVLILVIAMSMTSTHFSLV